MVKVGYNTGNKYIFSPTINVRNSALCNLLCVYFSIGNPQVGKKNKQNNNLLIIKNFHIRVQTCLSNDYRNIENI